MTLEEKGAIVPAPIMTTYPQRVSEAIQKWANVISATHWHLYDNTRADGADFYVGNIELGHIHLNGTMHLATNIELKKTLLKYGVARKFPFGGEYSSWVQFKIASEANAKQAIWLFKLNYERLIGVPMNTLIN